MWTGHDTLLIVYAVVAILLVVLMVAAGKVHPFIALTIGSLFMGLASGIGVDKVLESYEGGVGDTLGEVGILVALGTMLGKLLADSGGAKQIADTILERSGTDRIPWAMALIAMIVGIPLFFEIGVVLLIPLIFVVAERVKADSGDRSGNTYLLVGIPALAGLSVLHGLVPPHPGPLAAISALDANLGLTILYGFIIAIPTVIVAGPLFARFATHWAHADPPADLREQVASEAETDDPPSFGLTLFTVLLPVAIMLARTLIDVIWDEEDTVRKVGDFVGDPVVALLIGVLVAMWTLGLARGFDRQKVSDLLGASLAPAASILIIIGAGGGFKGVLSDAGISDAIAKGVENTSISPLIIAWGVAVMIRLATGSATVATITTAGIVAGLAGDVPPELLVLAVGTGSLFFSHVNDAGFWLINQYFGMSVVDTIKTWSVMETLISVVGFAGVLVLSLVV